MTDLTQDWKDGKLTEGALLYSIPARKCDKI